MKKGKKKGQRKEKADDNKKADDKNPDDTNETARGSSGRSNYYRKSADETIKELDTSKEGLSEDEAKKRLEKYGRNSIKEDGRISPLKILIQQFNSPVIWILLAAVAISVFLGEAADSIIITVILVLNAIIGFFQEYRAEKAIEALKKMASPKAIVLRDGKEKEIDAAELVPGDIIVLQTGEKIPADARLMDISNLQIMEAPLTGESLPVKKTLKTFDKDMTIGDRKNMVYSGTMVTKGRGKAIVTETGMKTEIGRIADMIQTTESEKTPLQKQLKYLGKWLGAITVVIAGVVFATGVIKGEPLLDFFLVAVALAVAAIPEGLPVVVTVALALGIRKMVKRNALIRKLPSVETLGSTTVICTDKTGTLTHNEMTVKKIFIDDDTVEVSGSGYKPEGSFTSHPKDLNLILKIGALNNDSSIDEEDGQYSINGDPTEGALVVSAAKAGLDKKMLENKHERIDEVQFSSERKMMTTVHKFNGNKFSYVKGAPDVMLKKCSHIIEDGKKRKITKKDKDKILKKNEEFADEALRVLGFAYKDLGKKASKKDYEKDLVFVGLQGMIDPPREEVKKSIATCKDAGIKVIMVTGDFKGTAMAIAEELGIEGKAVSGDELKNIDLEKEVMDIAVFARVNPEHKLDIVKALKKKGHIVAMTGDGVNDAPALKKADIGVSMGITGTDVAKEASDMILTDDNFASIVNAVEEGRGVYDNIKKFLAFLLSGNIGEVMIIFLATLFGWGVPLTAPLILMINLVTDGLPATALSADPFEPGRMKRQPRNPKASIFKGLNPFLIFYPALMITVGLICYWWFWNQGNEAKAITAVFLSIAMFEVYQAYSCRSTIFPSLKVGLFKNWWLNGAILTSIAAILVVIYVPAVRQFFETAALTWKEFLIIVAVSSIGSIYLEIHKFISSRGMSASDD
ncbi:calcium-translocating P-type ATPase, SERCA-type [Candidatus Woesearchaeota archaeon]|nr:calcium-translocating P-type ATPase, SERCA-type [Candidatus Woesearchaeota archaeon]